MNDDLRERNGDAFLVKSLFNQDPEVSLNLEVVALHGLHDDRIADAGIVKGIDAQDAWFFVADLLVFFVVLIRHFLEDFVDMIVIFLIGNRYIDDGHIEVTGIIDDRGDRTVWNDDLLALPVF